MVPSGRLSAVTSRLQDSIGLKGASVTLSKDVSPGTWCSSDLAAGGAPLQWRVFLPRKAWGGVAVLRRRRGHELPRQGRMTPPSASRTPPQLRWGGTKSTVRSANLNGRSQGGGFRPECAAARRERPHGFRIFRPHQGAAREAQQVHGRGYLPGRARLRGAAQRRQGPLAAPAGDGG